MAPPDNGFGPRKRRKISPKGTVPYVLRSLFDQVPLTTEDHSSEVHITCMEYWSKLPTPNGREELPLTQ